MIANLVVPNELQLADADNLLIGPQFDEKEIANGQDAVTSALAIGVFEGFVKRVGAVLSHRRADQLESVHRVDGALLILLRTGCRCRFHD